MSELIRRSGFKWLNLLVWLAITLAGLYLLRPNPVLTGTLAMAYFAARAFAIWRRKRVKAAIEKIGETDDRCVRFDGTFEQAQAAIAIGEAQGWSFEEMPQDNPRMLSVRFRREDGAATARDLVDAFFQAGLLIRSVEA